LFKLLVDQYFGRIIVERLVRSVPFLGISFESLLVRRTGRVTNQILLHLFECTCNQDDTKWDDGGISAGRRYVGDLLDDRRE
jgi:hypothetical protein